MNIDKISVGDKFRLLKFYFYEGESGFEIGTVLELIGINDYPMTFGFRDENNREMWLLPGGLEHVERLKG